MDRERARHLAIQLMVQHGLTDWLFRWGRGKLRLGSCNYTRRTISLSGHYVDLNDEEHVRDTILHEIAHALTGPKNGHNHVWKDICRRIGADPTRLDRIATVPEAPYELYCPGCEQVIAKRYRRVSELNLRRHGCRYCGPKSRGKLVFRARK